MAKQNAGKKRSSHRGALTAKQTLIEKRQAKLSEKAEITRERVLEELGKIAFAELPERVGVADKTAALIKVPNAAREQQIAEYVRNWLSYLADLQPAMESPDTPDDVKEFYVKMKEHMERAALDPYVFAREITIGSDGKAEIRL